ncbi:MAG TPA: pitrilysin family protein [Longimicrobiales bacterium]|nr:pitrilysin family protein [Longimicrobiales bacterium]
MMTTMMNSTIAGGTRRTATIALLAAFAGACASAAPQPQQPLPAADRTVRPAVAEAPDVTLPPIQQFTLANGMRVLLMEKRDLPLIQLNLVIGAGSVLDDAARPGLASLTAAMLDEGAAGHSALDIANTFEMLGARFAVGAGAHTASMSLRAPSLKLPDALRTAADVIMRPDFPDAELERLRKERLTALLRRYDDPGSIASALFDETLFGSSHAYGRSAFGTDASLRSIGIADLRAFYQRHYTPDNTTAIVVGDIDAAQARQLLESAFGSWRRGAGAATVTVPQAPQVRGRTIYLVDKPGAAQSVIRLGRIGVPRSSDDYYALEVMNTILGGSFTSRLNQNLRETNQYSYGASSGFSFLPSAGPWFAGASVQTQSTGPALTEFFNELRRMHQPIPADEVDRARNFLAMRYPAGFQSVGGIAGRLGDMVQFGLAPDYFNRFVDNILAVSNSDVERVARQYLDPDNVAIIVVGDRSVIEAQVRAQNLGDIRFLEVTDVLGPMPVMQE